MFGPSARSLDLQSSGFTSPDSASMTPSAYSQDRSEADEIDTEEVRDLLSSRLLNELNASLDENNPAESQECSGATSAEDAATWYSSPLKGNVRNIWKESMPSNSTSSWDRFEPYADENEFDPTLKLHQGSLLDSDTIEDMNNLSLSVTNPSLEESQAENVEEDMSPLQMLESVFTDLSEAELKDALMKHDYDVDRAMEALINQKLNVPTATAQPTIEDTPKRRQVCRHYLAGECYRKDCWFAHDLEVKVCKFWLQNSCLKGDACEFAHQINVQEFANKLSTPSPKKAEKKIPFNENEYPELSKSIIPSSQPQKILQPSSKKFPNRAQHEEFPSLSAAASLQRSGSNQGQKPVDNRPINFAAAAKIKPTHSPLSSGTAKGVHKKPQISIHYLRKPVVIPWLETGSALNVDYLKQREKAIEYGMLRNRFFERSREYYLKGDGAKAKAFSQEAKNYNHLMQEMHAAASQRIFEQRNQSEAFIDLHGLHVDEALDMLMFKLESLHGYGGVVYVVTGTGHHSGTSGLSKKQSKLKPIVESFLLEANYRFAETSVVGDTKGGVFAVDLSFT